MVPLLHQDGPHEHEDPAIIATLTEALIEGIVKGEAEAVKKVQKEIIDKESTCMTNDELEEWVEEVKPKIGIVYSFSFIDFESSDEAF